MSAQPTAPWRRASAGPVLLVLLAPALAAAQPRNRRVPLFAQPVLAVGGGVEGFTTSSVRAVAGDGGAWVARLSGGDRQGVRLELAYVGSAQPLDPDQGTWLIGHGVQARLRINLAPWVGAVEPFLYAGGGWTRFRARGHRPGAAIAASDDVLEIPLGAGISRRIGRCVLDLRASITAASGADLLPAPTHSSGSVDSAAMHRYGVIAGAGFEL